MIEDGDEFIVVEVEGIAKSAENVIIGHARFLSLC
jgi:hypothetical protein